MDSMPWVRLLVQAGERGVRALAVFGDIQSQGLVCLVNAQVATAQGLNHKNKNKVENQDDGDGDRNTQHLSDQQRGIAGVEQAAKVGPGQLGHAEQAGEDAAHDAADAVATKGVESVVIAKASLEVGDSEEADGRNGGANNQRGPGLDKAGGPE